MQAEAEENPRAMTAARIGQLRALGSELGMDPASRARLAPAKPPDDDWDYD
jgi:phage terminase small subunit